MKTEHYNPPIADELAAHEECRRRPEMVDKELQRACELHLAAEKIREMLFPEIRGKRSELDEAQLRVQLLKNEIDNMSKLTGLLGMLLCEDRFEMEEKEEDDYADGFWPQGLEE
jgi:hypothetical protein